MSTNCGLCSWKLVFGVGNVLVVRYSSLLWNFNDGILKNLTLQQQLIAQFSSKDILAIL